MSTQIPAQIPAQISAEREPQTRASSQPESPARRREPLAKGLERPILIGGGTLSGARRFESWWPYIFSRELSLFQAVA